MPEFPPFYDPSRIGTLFYPDQKQIEAEALQAGLAPADGDNPRVLFLLIDMQVTFCHDNGALYVPGAKDDIRRIIEFLYRNAGRITQITCSLDSHHAFQIFHPSWWADADGRHPPAFTQITKDDVESGRWRALRDQEWSMDYVRRLEEEAKKQLTIWPYHALMGSVDHALDPELWSAIFWHSIARRSQPTWWRKGSIPRTEHYSIVRPEIDVPNLPDDGSQRDFLDAVGEYDFIVIAGEASSHCVLESLADLVELFRDTPEKLDRIYVLRDCMSPVRHPAIDFDAIAKQAFAEYEKQGVRFLDSTAPMPF